MSQGVAIPRDRTRALLLLTAALFTGMTLTHDLVQEIFRGAQRALPAPIYNGGVVGIGLAAGLLVGIAAGRRLGVSPRRAGPLLGWLTVGGLIGLSFALLVAITSEAIHFPQYALIAWPLHALTRSHADTVAWAALLGTADEGYQYWVLHADWNVYLDFNDIVLNVLGAGLGLLLLSTFAAVPSRRAPAPGRARRRPGWGVISFAAVLAGVALLYGGGGLALYPEGQGREAAVLLSRAAPSQAFWTVADWGQKSFHVLSPLAGIILVTGLVSASPLLDLAFRGWPAEAD